MTEANINTVLEQALTIVNKNQIGGYLDADEYNRYAYLSQYAWFNEAYQDAGANQNAQDNLAPLRVFDKYLTVSNGLIAIPEDYMHISTIKAIVYKSQTESKLVDVEILNPEQHAMANMAGAFEADKDFPQAVINGDTISIYPADITGIRISYIRQPTIPFWNYTVVDSEKVYAATGGSATNPNDGVTAGDSTQFEVPQQHEQDLVEWIVRAIGMEIRDIAAASYNNETGKPVQ